MPSSFATRAIGRDVSITILTASSLNSDEKLFFGRGNYFTFPEVHPNGWTVRKLRGTPHIHQFWAGQWPGGALRVPCLAWWSVWCFAVAWLCIWPCHGVGCLLARHGRPGSGRHVMPA